MNKNTLNKEYIDDCLNEFFNMKQNSGNNSIYLPEAALLIEDLFCTVLTDEEICSENLGNMKNLKRFVQNKVSTGRDVRNLRYS